ncbi:MAG: squalene/phytoene synthase family protein, partial [Candidatus Eremiobacteraeota bacterium]|nr:squalene/phytoene synthase family protein [Candidatus Eremiobacteraeota bacterium]
MNRFEPAERNSLALDLLASERYCQQMARREAKNFYWGFISLPYDQRMAIYALYDFARQIDDVADASSAPHLPERLKPFRHRVHRCMRGEFSDPVTQVLAQARRVHAARARAFKSDERRPAGARLAEQHVRLRN